MKTQWLTKFYDPRKPPPKPPKADGCENERRVLAAIVSGKLTCIAVVEHTGIPQKQVAKHQQTLAKRGLLIGIGQGGARRYLVNKTVG
jgi:hypothetical protein